MTPEQQLIWDFLVQDRDAHRACGHDLKDRGYAYSGEADFLLQHGRWYRPRPLPRHVRRGAPKLCFANALIATVRHGLQYVEGYATGIIPVAHAWGVDARGRLYELTWREPGTAYLGVVFSPERADDAQWRGDSCVLNDYRRRFPLFRQPWAGEPAVSLIQPTPWLTLARQGRWAEAYAWAHTHVEEDP